MKAINLDLIFCETLEVSPTPTYDGVQIEIKSGEEQLCLMDLKI